MNDADSIDRKIENLRISAVNRNLARANFAAAEASVDHIARVLTWIRSFIAATPRDEHQARWYFRARQHQKGEGEMQVFLGKSKGEGSAASVAMPSWKNVALAWLGGVLAIATIAQIGDGLSLPLILGSFGASCVLVFGFPDLPFSQPRNVVAGHFLSSLIGLSFLALFGPHWWSLALAVGTAIATMMLTRTVHPPAGSNPVIVFLAQPAWSFLWFPTLIGALLLVLVALLYNNVARPTAYPKYW